MKKLILLSVSLLVFGCSDFDQQIVPISKISDNLKISENVGIKLETLFVSDEVSVNLKMDKATNIFVKIFDISNKVVSKEEINVKEGDNVIKMQISVLPSSAYRIGIYENNTLVAITDFNKI